jgi:hypothetical protein
MRWATVLVFFGNSLVDELNLNLPFSKSSLPLNQGMAGKRLGFKIKKCALGVWSKIVVALKLHSYLSGDTGSHVPSTLTVPFADSPARQTAPEGDDPEHSTTRNGTDIEFAIETPCL